MALIVLIALGGFLGVLLFGLPAISPRRAGAGEREVDVSYRDLLESAVDLIQGVTLDGRLIYTNPAWRQVLGYSEEEVDGLSLFDLVHPEYRGECVGMFERVKRGEGVDHFETVFLARDGRPLTLAGSFSCSFKGDAPDAILGVLQNITERKRAEEVLARQASELFKVNEMLEEKDRELADTLDQAQKYQEAQDRARELGEINEELKAEIVRRQQAETQIRASLREKEVLLKEIHHRVKNNLQIISSLLNLQAEQMGGPENLGMFRESQDRVQSMALIHEKLYQSEDLARVDFSEYIQGLVSYLLRSYASQAGRVRPVVEVEEIFLGIDTAIPCGLVINELVSNALKYAFPDGRSGEVRVALRSDGEDRFTLTVGDDGVGFPDELDFRNTESLGLQLVITLVDQLEGSIELDRSGGTEFKMDFTALKYDSRG